LFARPGYWDNKTSFPDQKSEGPIDPSSESVVEQKPEAATAILRDVWEARAEAHMQVHTQVWIQAGGWVDQGT
jgi:hypothetical protein